MSPEITRINGSGAARSAFLTWGGVEQPERDVQCLAETSVGIVVHFSGVHDDADTQLPLRPAGAWQACVVIGQQLAQDGDGGFQQDRLGCPVYRVDEREDPVATVDEPVPVPPVDT